ncbi:hypothetical protein M3J09_008550 [Ascochyta lentis]
MSTENESQIQVDPKYGDSAPEVYREFASQYIRANKRLTILDHIIHDAQSLQANIPSWVPNWDYRENGPRYVLDDALTSRTGSVYKPALIGRSLLKVRGVILEPVGSITGVFDRPAVTMETLASVWAAIRPYNSANPYSSLYSLRAFISTLTEGRLIGYISTSVQQKMLYLHVLEDACNSSGGRIPEGTDIGTSVVHAFIQEHVEGKNFMLTERGYMGLGPAIAQEGDMCGIIFGCSMPCILRKTEQSNRYRFIGRCFALGNQTYETLDGYTSCVYTLGSTNSKEWVDWDVEEQDIYLC